MTQGRIWQAVLVAAGLMFATAMAAQTPDLYYKFNDGTGTTATNDGSVGGDATFSATPAWLTPGQVGSSAVSFPTSVELPTGLDPSTGLAGSFTLEAWVRTSSGQLAEWLGSNNATTAAYFYWYQQADGSVSFLSTDSTGAAFRFDGSISINDGSWHHIAVVYDDSGPSMEMYVDGAADAGAITGTGAMPLDNGAQNLIIGDNSLATVAGSADWTGDVDDLRVWSVARTASEIADNFAIELGQATPEIAVTAPNGDELASGGSHLMDPVASGGAGTFDWTIRNLHPTAGLNLGTITVTATSGGSVSVTADPSGTTVAAQSSATLTVEVTGNSGLGAIVVDISIPSDDADEDPFNITANGSRGMSGTYTVNNAGGASYLDIGAVFDDLEEFGVSGAVTVEVSEGGAEYSSDPSYELGSDDGVPNEVLGTSSTNTIEIVAAAGEAPVIEGAGVDFDLNGFVGGVGMLFTAVSHLTLEGFEYDGGGTTGGCDAGIVVWNEEGLFPGSNLTFRSNRIHNIVAGNGLLAVYNLGAGLDGLVVENNMFWDMGLTIGTFSGPQSDLFTGAICMFRPTATCAVRHNSVLITETFFPTQAGTCYQHLGGGADLGELNYNIFYNMIPNAPCVNVNIGTPTAPNPAPPAASNRNVFYFPNGIMSQTFTSFANWQTQLSLDNDSVEADPEFTSDTAPIDMRISTSSPAIDLAEGSSETVDFEGDTRPAGDHPDTGADENTNTGGGGGGGNGGGNGSGTGTSPGGNGGGCTAVSHSTPWLVLLGLLFAAVAALRLCVREE